VLIVYYELSGAGMQKIQKLELYVIALQSSRECEGEQPYMLVDNSRCLLSLNTYPHTFSLCSVGVIIDETWTLSLPLTPTVRYVL
jgi:hypothetical protein